jgi:hypothetical protein
MWGMDGTSWKYKRPCFVTDAFQVSKRAVERHPDEARDIFNADVSGPGFVNKSAHLRPERTVISRASSESGNRVGLTGRPAHKDIWSGDAFFTQYLRSQGTHIIKHRYIRPMLCELTTAPCILLTKGNGGHTRPRRA